MQRGSDARLPVQVSEEHNDEEGLDPLTRRDAFALEVWKFQPELEPEELATEDFRAAARLPLTKVGTHHICAIKLAVNEAFQEAMGQVSCTGRQD